MKSQPQPARSLMPWFVKKRDLLRYFRRALDACDRGRVVLFRHHTTLMALALESHDWPSVTDAAILDFKQNRFRNVTLADLPKRRK